MDFDFVVAGSGLAGLSAAALLAGQGLRVCVIEARGHADILKPSSRTTAVLSPYVRFLESHGLAPRKLTGVNALTRMVIRDGSGEAVFSAQEVGELAFAWNVPNAGWLSALYDVSVSHDAVFHYGEEITRLEVTSGHISVICASGKAISAKLLVAADGRGSVCRKLVGIKMRARQSPLTALTAIFTHDWPHEDTSYEIYDQGQSLTFVPLSDPQTSALVWMARNHSGREDAAVLLEALTPRCMADLGAALSVKDIHTWPVGSGMAARMSALRTVLLGDTAHALSPIVAQGYNETLRDLKALLPLVKRAQRLGLDIGGGNVCVSYHDQRHGKAALRSHMIDAYENLVRNDHRLASVVRRFGLRMLDNLPALRHKLARQGMA